MIAYRSTVELNVSDADSEKYKEYLVFVDNKYISSYYEFSSSPFRYESSYSDVYVGKVVNSCSGILSRCTNFNNNVYIGENVSLCAEALYGCNNFSSHIYFKGTTSRNIWLDAMLYGAGKVGSAYYPKYLHCHKNLAPAIYNAYLVEYDESISWTNLVDNNGWYNSLYNIYLYNNYSG